MAFLGIVVVTIMAYKAGMDECIAAHRKGKDWKREDRHKAAVKWCREFIRNSQPPHTRDEKKTITEPIITSYVDGTHTATEYWHNAAVIHNAKEEV